ncbi:MAG: phosphoribosylglycinamide formyltransferase [Acidimicrobiales bacterium]
MRIAVLASGSGTLLDAICADGIPVALVVVDRNSLAIDIARKHGVPVVLLERESFGRDFDRVAYTERVVDVLQQHEIDLVVMAGWLTIFEKPMFEAYDSHILNTHPALLPAFPGMNAYRQALEYGVKVTGCTIHIATPAVDDGPILAQEPVRVYDDDTVNTLAERIKEVERQLYPQVIREFVDRGGPPEP